MMQGMKRMVGLHLHLPHPHHHIMVKQNAATPLFLLLFTVFVLTLPVSLSPYDLYLQRGLFRFNTTHFIITPIKQTNRPKRGLTKTKAAMCCWLKVRLHTPFEADSLQIFNVWWEKNRYG